MATGIQTGIRRSGRQTLTPGQESPGQRCLSWWNALSSRTRRAGLGLVLALVGLSLLSVVHYSRNQYVPLYQTGLNEKDLPAVSRALDEMGIDHRVPETLDGVLVHPRTKVRALAGLASRSLPLHDVSVENEQTMTATAAERQALRQDKLAAEITLALRQVEGINDARVTLALPKRKYFMDKDEVATATVLLSLYPGHDLDRERTASLVHLVAFSVQGLQPENVRVVDTRGRDLTAELPRNQEGRLVAGGSELEVRAHEEQRLQSKIQEALDRAFPGKTRVLVNLTMDFSEMEKREYTPGSEVDNGMVKDSVQLIKEILEQEAEKDGKKYDNHKESINYKYMEKYLAILTRHARTSRVTASVMADGLSDKQAGLLENVVKGAIGYDEGRGDTVYVDTTPWDHEMVPPPILEPLATTGGASSPKNSEANLMGWLAAGQSMLLFGILLAFGSQRFRSARKAEAELEQAAPQPSVGIVDHHLQKSGTQIEHGRRTRVHPSEVFSGMVKEHPTCVAARLRDTWLKG